MIKKRKKERKQVQIAKYWVTVVSENQSYPHFDTAVLNFDKKRKILLKYYNNPSLVTTHQFLPVILREKGFLKVSYDKSEKKLKFKNKIRPIVEVGHQDSLIFSLYAAMLNQNYEQRVLDLGIEKVATAYRRGRGSNIESSKEVIDRVFDSQTCWIIKSDFVGFFDNLNQSKSSNDTSKS